MYRFSLVVLASFVLNLGLQSCKAKKQVGFNYLQYTASAEEIAVNENKMERLYYMLVGHFSNRKQSNDSLNNALYQEQEIIAVPIWRKRTGEYWLYMGWFTANLPDKPLAQGIFQLSKHDRDTFILKFSLPPKEVERNFYAGEWRKEEPFADLGPKDLEHDEGCVNYVVARENGKFEIISKGDYCKRFISEGIRYFDFKALLEPERQIHYTSFYDVNKNMVFEYPRPVGLRYERLSKDKPKY